MSEVKDIQVWLEEILDEPVDWQINPETVRILNNLRMRNVNKEEHAKIILEEAERSRAEYEGEIVRLGQILRSLGVEERVLSGPSNAYIEVLTESCSALQEEGIGLGLEGAALRLLLQQAKVSPEIVALRAQVEAIKSDTLKLYGQLDRLGEAVETARKESDIDTTKSVNQSKKLDFMRAKEKQYKLGLDKDELLLVRNTGSDSSSGGGHIRHAKITDLAAKLHSLEAEAEASHRHIAGYLSLPPSCDLARVEIVRAEQQLADLTEKVNDNISTMHL